ncbi:MAG TPA: hypothetical protein VEC99_01050 [Clostridia bacterium]|nr:hypothetical protein [Clostridia bacterium]
MTPLPVPQSDVIVVGRIVKAAAYLSADETAIYSEFSFVVREILKNSSTTRLQPDQTITVRRLGGTFQFPSGRSLTYAIGNERPLRRGEDVVLFLKSSPETEDFEFLLAYQLRNAHVFQVDAKGGRYAQFENMGESEFLNLIRRAISESGQAK